MSDMNKIKRKAVRKETRRFSIVGFAATFLDYAVFNIFVGIFHFPIIAVNIVSTSLGSVVSYYLNREVVFDSERHSSKLKTWTLYALVVGAGIYGIQSIVLFLVNHYLPGMGVWIHETFAWLHLGEHIAQTNFSKVCASFCSAIWNFFLLRKYVFVPLTDNPKKHVES